MSGDDIEMDLNQIENELIVQLSDNHHSSALAGAHLSNSVGQPMGTPGNQMGPLSGQLRGSMLQGSGLGQPAPFHHQSNGTAGQATMAPAGGKAGQQSQQQ